MPDAVANLLSILDPERLEENLFRGLSIPEPGRQRVFGGQVVAQALVAASRTVEGRTPHSMHAYFLLPGDPAAPIIYDVDRIRDGGSFTTRRVLAIQHGREIFSMSVSFHIAEPGLSHQMDMPPEPAPDAVADWAGLDGGILDALPPGVRAYFTGARAIELRPVSVTRYLDAAPLPPRQALWLRAAAALPDDDAVHRAVLAYASDMTLLDTALVAHGSTVYSADVMVASLDHALWFHAPFRADDWLLYVQDSPFAGGARGFSRGLIYARDGRLVASAAQEGLIRPRTQR
jgi:acyl-CoA thioesterase-2